ncbi:MAG TPA: hypothetical protein VH116_00570 [Gemmatimonadales bacterium]|jgi:hypothetical protein|nr:hypothetical protein [Gemmatimonadales bacterium]
MKSAALVVLGVAVLVGCQDQARLTAPRRLSAALSDGSVTGGNPHFFFLPPLVSQPSFSGTFNPNIRPVVEVCQLDVDVLNLPLGCNATAPLILPGVPVLDLADGLYQVNWDTGLSGVLDDGFYRIRVRAAPGGTVLGFADIQLVDNHSEVRNVNTDQYIGLTDGRTVPIKFRIENGIVCQTLDCFEGTVGPAGGTFVTTSGLAGTLFPPGAVTQDVLLAIDRIDTRPCVPVDLPQFNGCYHFSTDPFLAQGFATHVTVGICLDQGTLSHAQADLLHIAQFDAGQPVRMLTNVPATFMPCDPHHVTTVGSGFSGGLRALARLLGSLLAPAELHASHLGVGGDAGSYSTFGWALPGLLGVVGDNPLGVVGTAVATPPAVLVTDSLGNAIAGATVRFAVAGGGGAITGPVALTGSDGVARVGSWTLGSQSGPNTMTATTVGATNSTVTLTVTAAAGPAAQLVLTAGNGQSATVSSAVATPPSVVVLDQFNNPVTGVPVTFAVASGGGTVSPTAAVVTDASGAAALTAWTLGPTAGTNTLTASVAGASGSAATFSATATAPLGPLLP